MNRTLAQPRLESRLSQRELSTWTQKYMGTTQQSDDLYEAALSEMSSDDPDVGHVFELLSDAVAGGSPRAAYALGTWYLHGEHVDQDIARGIMLMNRAAQSKVPEALYDLAVTYELGKGVAVDEHRAFRFYVEAALYGDDQSVYEVGRCYYHGIGVDRDECLSEIWLSKARSLGISE